MIFGILWMFRRRKKFDGQIFWLYVLIYGITRSVIEIFRGEFILGVISVSQAIGITFALTAAVMLVIFNKKNSR
ncbi:MAG: hypothetical protein BWK80_36090 [Desulfobacteraceae bacterium IS3]|nr:MAG: hypothetical protein BWK80_36090 [Desulfobacteraceae bacterium IS3]